MATLMGILTVCASNVFSGYLSKAMLTRTLTAKRTLRAAEEHVTRKDHISMTLRMRIFSDFV